MIAIGIMQGRLLPPFEDRFQAFPANNWRKEFEFGKTAGIDCIEWIFEKPHEAENPISTDDGIAELKSVIKKTGIEVRSICADYFMTERLILRDGSIDAVVVAKLMWLVEQAQKLGVTYMVIPFVDISSLSSEVERNGLIKLMQIIGPLAAEAGIEIHLETDFFPDTFSHILSQISHSHIKANFDIGNSAALGFDPTEEMSKISKWLGSVHVKDRILNGTTVPLGAGNADLQTAFKMIKSNGFDRWLILQVARDVEGNETAWIKEIREHVEDLWLQSNYQGLL